MSTGSKGPEIAVGNLLRAGVLLAAAVVLAGAAVYLFRHGRDLASYAVFRGEPPDLRSLNGIVAGAARFSGRRLIQFGFLLLIATPIARVAFSAIAFARQRDRTYVAITFVVLAVLCYSLFGHA